MKKNQFEQNENDLLELQPAEQPAFANANNARYSTKFEDEDLLEIPGLSVGEPAISTSSELANENAVETADEEVIEDGNEVSEDITDEATEETIDEPIYQEPDAVTDEIIDEASSDEVTDETPVELADELVNIDSSGEREADEPPMQVHQPEDLNKYDANENKADEVSAVEAITTGSQAAFVPETVGETARKSGLAYSAALTLFGSVIVLMIVGWLADKFLGTSPWGIVVGIVLGAIFGFYQFFKINSQIFKK